MSPLALPDRLSERRIPLAVVAVALLGLSARLFRLGTRVFYYDEAWFGYWTLKFLDHGAWEYRPILHGPFFVRINSVVFPLLGANDMTARLVVALVGGLLPLSAWLFRDRLRDAELVALAAALAFNPVLLYYSRFMRKDLPLAAFMFVTLGLLVRAADTRRPGYLYAAAVSLGVAFATKESVLLWLITWLGAGTLVLDRRLLRARDRGGTVSATLRAWAERARAAVRYWGVRGAIAGAIFLAVVVYFYAPRAGAGQEIGFWRALGGAIGTLPAVVGAATVGSFEKAIDYWATGSIQRHPYLPYLGDTLQTLAAGAVAVSVLSVVGFLADRYTGDAPRDIVAFNFYSGVAATVGYPLANNLPVPWSTVHAVVPLTVPAAVGAAVIYRWGRGRLPAREPDVLGRLPASMGSVRAGVAAAVLTLLVVSAGTAAVETSYLQPHESPRAEGDGSEVVYYAQAPGELRTVTAAIDRAAASDGSDVDVLYVGSSLAMDESAVERPPGTGAWHARIPLPWYTEAAGADVASVARPSGVGDSPPPVVVSTTSTRDAVAERLGDGYAGRTYLLDDIGDRSVVVFLR